jgi:hypothetical protein
MIEGSDDDFLVRIVDAEGNESALMDRETAEFLLSDDPDPTQASLDAAFDGVTRVRLMAWCHDDDLVMYDSVRLDVSDPGSIAELAHALRIVDADEFGHVMSPGLNRLELWSGDRHAHTLELPEWDTIRWSEWKGDASVAEPRRLADWMARHRVAGPHEYLDGMAEGGRPRALPRAASPSDGGCR